MKITLSWLTIISFCLNLILGGLGIYQFLDSKNKEENIKTFVRIWQNSAEGISNGLLQISQNPKLFSSVEDMSQAVGVAAQSARGLNEAMIQQRFYSDEEVKKQKEKSQEEIKQLLKQVRNSQ